MLGDAGDVLRGCERLGLALSQAADGGRAGRVRISAPPGFTRACLLPALPPFLDAHPEIHVEIQASYDLVDLADEGVDLALRTGPLAGTLGHISQRLLSSPWGAYATPGYLARRGTPSSPANLADHDLVGFRNSATGRLGAWHFQNRAAGGESGVVHHDADARIVFDDGSAAYDMACNGYGIVWAPEWLALGDVRRGRVVEVLRDWRSGEMLMSIVRRDRRHTPQRDQGRNRLSLRNRQALASSRGRVTIGGSSTAFIPSNTIQVDPGVSSLPISLPDEGKIRDYRRLFRRTNGTTRDRDEHDPGAAFDELSKLLFLKAAEDDWLSRNVRLPAGRSLRRRGWRSSARRNAASERRMEPATRSLRGHHSPDSESAGVRREQHAWLRLHHAQTNKAARP